MTLQHRIDTSGRYHYDPAAKEPAKKAIEIASDEPVPAKNWRTADVAREPYLADAKLGEVVNLAISLGRPLLLQGDPGCGKTQLAYAVAYALGLPLEECYIKSTSRAQDLLYTYDAVSRLYDVQIESTDRSQKRRKPKSTDPGNYVRLGPLGRAIARASFGRRTVVLIDEIDKADIDFPNDLLRELERLEFEVAEVPGKLHRVPRDRKDLRPIIFITHNEEKALPTAFLRRCIYHYVEFPGKKEQLEAILTKHDVAPQELCSRAIDVLLELRKLDLQKKPGVSELLDWVGYLNAVKAPLSELPTLRYGEALLKHMSDQQRARERMKEIGPAPDDAGPTRVL